MDRRIHFEVTDGCVTKFTLMPGTKDLYRTEVIMTKEIFKECYEKWIKPQNEDINKKEVK